MIKIFSKILLIFIFVTSCGFEPMYSNNNNINKFQINDIKLSGDRELNIFINSNLLRYTKIENTKKYDLEINTIYKKNIISKTSSGNASEYKLEAIINILIKNNNESLTIDLNENFLMPAQSDKIKEKDYEKNTKFNIAKKITDQIILKILSQ